LVDRTQRDRRHAGRASRTEGHVRGQSCAMSRAAGIPRSEAASRAESRPAGTWPARTGGVRPRSRPGETCLSSRS
jgi:hypothetical protein